MRPWPTCSSRVMKGKSLYQSVLTMETQRLSTSQCGSTINYVVRDSSAGIATRYELDVPEIESSWRNPSRQALQPIQPPAKWVQVLCSSVKPPSRGVDHPPHPAPRIKKEYSYTPFSPSGPLVKSTFTLQCVPIGLKSGSLNRLEPSGPVKACNGIALPYLTMSYGDRRCSQATAVCGA
jgi:hypothetical protein